MNVKKILYVTTVLFNYAKSGGEVATQNFLDVFADLDYVVDLVGYNRKGNVLNRKQGNKYYYIVEDRQIETDVKTLEFWLWMIKSFFVGSCYSVAKYYCAKFEKKISHLLVNNVYDLIVVEHSQLLPLLNIIKKYNKDAPIVFNSQNVEHVVYSDLSIKSNSFLKRLIYKRESKLMAIVEKKGLRLVNQVWTLTEKDKNKYLSLVNVNCLVMPVYGNNRSNCTDVFSQKQECRFDVVMLGTWSWQPNKDGLIWFLKSIFPRLKKYNLKIGIAGKGADSILFDYKNDIDYLGFVENQDNFLLSGNIIVIPTTEGGGIQIKTLDAIATGKYVVTTPMGVRGLSNLPNTVSICSDPENFSQAILKLIRQELKLDDTNLSMSWVFKRRCTFHNRLAGSLFSLVGGAV